MEKFHRDPNKSANDDISQRTYLFDERKILIVYHYEENRITPSSREFYLPVLSGDQTQLLTMNPDMTSAYQVCNLTSNLYPLPPSLPPSIPLPPLPPLPPSLSLPPSLPLPPSLSPSLPPLSPSLPLPPLRLIPI